jgi:hypothetical protein
MSGELDRLINSTPGLWKGGRSGAVVFRGIPTGYRELDQMLPGKGWPRGVVIELMLQSIGIGELEFMLPAIRVLISDQRFIMMVSPPYLPYAPALMDAGLDLDSFYLLMPESSEDGLWAAEKALLNPLCGMVLLWSDSVPGRSCGFLSDAVVRRLQVAAQESQAILVVYRVSVRTRPVRQSSWAAIRFGLSRQGGKFVVDVLRVRGTCRRGRLRLNLEGYD